MNCIHTAHRLSARSAQQRGIAAIEFALVFMVLFALLYGIVTFGAIFSTQHALTRAAEDGARVISMYPNPTELQIQAVVLASLDAPLKDTPDLQVSASIGTNPVVVTIIYPYRDNTLPSSIAAWLPSTLTVRAFAAQPAF